MNPTGLNRWLEYDAKYILNTIELVDRIDWIEADRFCQKKQRIKMTMAAGVTFGDSFGIYDFIKAHCLTT